MLARVKAGISQVRGLDFIEPVEAEYLTTQELTDYLQGLMGEEEREELRQLDELLTLLGLMNTMSTCSICISTFSSRGCWGHMTVRRAGW